MGQRRVRDIPFTEIVERVKDLSRSAADVKGRIRGIVNDIYTREIPRMYDWPWLKANSQIAVIAEYDTGVASVTTQGTLVSFFSGAVITTAMTGRKIKFDNNPNIYDFVYNDASGGTINPPLSGEQNVGTDGYTIFKTEYSLPVDFDRWPINGGLLYMAGGIPTPIPEKVDDDFFEAFTASPTEVPEMVRLKQDDTAGCPQFEINPPPASAYVLGNEYIKFLLPMVEFSDGTIAITAGGTAVTGTSTKFTLATTGDYLRVDGLGVGADSDWYRITAITNDTTATLDRAFRSDTSVAAAAFVISMAPRMPYRMQDALVYGAIEKILTDQNDPMLMFAHVKYAEIMTDNKVLDRNRKAKDEVELIAEDAFYRF